jgi:hypothetical protein
MPESAAKIREKGMGNGGRLDHKRLTAPQKRAKGDWLAIGWPGSFALFREGGDPRCRGALDQQPSSLLDLASIEAASEMVERPSLLVGSTSSDGPLQPFRLAPSGSPVPVQTPVQR